MYKRAVAVAALASVFAASAEPVIPASVLTVVSGGYWKEAQRDGLYRAIVSCDGWEHVKCRLFVQWVVGPKSQAAEQTVVAAVEAKLPEGEDQASFDVKLSPIGVGRLEVILSGVHTFEPKRSFRATFIAAQPGALSQIIQRVQR
jgi:hypothetical protein